MLSESNHLSDEDLLLSADGEMPAKRAAAVRRHLEACWECRARFADMENAIGDFIRMHREQFEGAIPPPDGPRSLLRAKLRALNSDAREHAAPWFNARYGAAFVAVALAIALMLASFRNSGRQYLSAFEEALIEEGAMPRPSLTPGETVAVTVQDVCTPSFPTERQMVIPAGLQQRVFEQYGIDGASPDAFEVDYLITPDLGGASSERNLWPEPYHNTVWNARVKDELEVHLKNLVCSGKLDISTAQRELAGNWVAAYKKYFRTNTSLGKPRRFLPLLARVDSRQIMAGLVARAR